MLGHQGGVLYPQSTILELQVTVEGKSLPLKPNIIKQTAKNLMTLKIWVPVKPLNQQWPFQGQ